MTPGQCKAARALLDWTQLTLANKANVSKSTVADFERYVRTPVPNNLKAFISVFEAEGLTFFKGGVVFNDEEV
jgi:transcriptional regulator with XRE-family HTH domain